MTPLIWLVLGCVLYAVLTVTAYAVNVWWVSRVDRVRSRLSILFVSAINPILMLVVGVVASLACLYIPKTLEGRETVRGDVEAIIDAATRN